MTLAVTLQASGGANAVNSPKTSASFTPPANAKLYALGWVQSGAGISGDTAPLTISDSAGLTWSTVATANLPAEFSSSVWLWEATVGASPSAMTVTITNTSLSGSGGAAIAHAVVAVTGNTPAVVSGQFKAAVTATGTSTLTAGPMPAAATAGNLTLIFAGANDDSGANLGATSGFTSLVNGGGPFETVKVEYSTTFAATSTTFANATDNEGAGVIIVEISEPTLVADGYIVQEDGTSKILLEDGTGSILGEAHKDQVTASRATSWNTKATVTATRSTTWNVASSLVSVTATRSTTWRTKARVTATRSTTWNTNGPTATTWFTAPGTSTPQFLMSAEDWGVLPNAAYNHAGDTTATWDDYFSHRQAQGYNCVQTCIFGYGSVAGFGLDGAVTPEGGDVDGVYPFNTNSNDPNNANNSTWWTRRDNFFAKARLYGFRVILNITTPNINAGTFLNSWTTAQWQAWGTKIGTYLAGPNLDHVLVIVADDYFGTKDAEMNAMLTNMRAAGATQPIAIQWYQETSSRRDIYTGNQPTTTNNFSNQADYNFGYSYSVWYDVTEKMGLENNTLTPIPYITADGTFLNTGGTSGITDKQLLRRQVWWSLSSGAKGVQVGDNNVWTWPTTALAETQSNTFYTSTVPAIMTAFRALPNWHLLLADTSNQLVTAGRGTHASPLVSGGSGGQYLSDTDSYVTASFIQSGTHAGELAVIYMSHASTITIDQTKMAAGYTAKWIDPASGAATSTATGSTYTTVGKPANSDGQNDWVLVLQKTTLTSVTASRSTTWNTKAQAAAARATTWDVLAARTATRATTWDTLTSTTGTRSTTWDVLSSRTATRATTWRTLAPVTGSRSTTWNVAGSLISVTSTRSSTWRVLARVTGSRATTWNVAGTLASVTGTRTTTWRVLARTTSTRATTWNTKATVAGSRSTTWRVLASAAAARSTTWRVLASAAAARSTTWRVLQRLTSSRATTWNVASSLLSVTKAASTTWRTLARTTATRSTTWNTKATVTGLRSTTWDVLRTIAPKAASTTWRVLVSAGTSARSTSWRTLARVTATRATSWAVQSEIIPPNVILRVRERWAGLTGRERTSTMRTRERE